MSKTSSLRCVSMGWSEFKSELSSKEYFEKFIKYFLLTVNILFEITGGVIAGIGIRLIFTVQRSSINALSLPIIFIIAGCVIVGISGLGFSSTKEGNVDHLKVYAWLLLIALVVNLICIIIANTVGSSAFGVPEESKFKEAFDEYGTNTNSTALVDKLQKSLHCCGYNGPESMVYENGTYPLSCCLPESTECKIPFIHRCKREITRVIYPMSAIAKVVFYTLPPVEFLSIVASFYLTSVLQRKKLIIQQDSHEYSNV
ncbi:putative tetraspanin family protein [Trypoxylus dichotomus]